MDSKMDSGYIAPGENHAQALEDDYDVRQSLTPEEVVGLMDQLLSHEVRMVLQEDRVNPCLRNTRWHGIWAILFHKPFLRPSTSTSCYGRYRRQLRMLGLIACQPIRLLSTSFSVHTLLRLSKRAILSMPAWLWSITMR